MRLLKSRILMFTLRRSAWIRWLPPIDSASPSPVTTHTNRSGRDTARPVPSAGGAGPLRGGAPGNRVRAVLFNVVGEGSGPADPRHEDHVLALDAERRH